MQKGSAVAGRGTAVDVPTEGNANGHGGPALRRRRALPGSRALFGGLLVAAAAVGLFAAYTGAGGGPSHSYVVLTRDVPAGTRLQSSDLALEPMELSPALRGRSFDDRSVLVGATVISPLAAGELVQTSAVVKSAGDTAHREITFSLERGRIGAGVKDGERVDVLATFGAGADAVTRVVVRDALILSIERSRTSLGDSAAAITVGLDDPDDVLAMAHASQLAKVTLVRSTGAPPLPAGADFYRSPTGAGS